MRLMHGSSTAVTCHRVAAAGEGAAAGVGAAVVGPRPRAQQTQAINTKGNSAGHITAIATAGCWVQCVFDAFRMSWPSQGAWPQYWIEQPSRSLSLPHDPSSPQQQPAWGNLKGSPVYWFEEPQPGQVYSQVKKLPSQRHLQCVSAPQYSVIPSSPICGLSTYVVSQMSNCFGHLQPIRPMRTQRKIRIMTISEQQETQRAFWRQVILFHTPLHKWNRKMRRQSTIAQNPMTTVLCAKPMPRRKYPLAVEQVLGAA